MQIYARYERGEAYVPGQKVAKQQLAGKQLEEYLAQMIGKYAKSDSSLENETDFFEFG